MSDWKGEEELRAHIKELVGEYYFRFKKKDEEFKPGDRVSYSSRVFDEKEMQSLVDASLDFWLTNGRFAAKFEKDFSNWIGVKYAHLVNSGSSANLIAFMALTAQELGVKRIERGDEVITVACGFPTTVSPVLQYGAVPVFVDVDIPSYNIKVSELEKALSHRTKAVILAHTMGNPFNIKVVKEFCDENGLWLIEDNCDSLASEYNMNGVTKHTGTWGDIGTSSFYPPHHITMGEGGCVYTDNPLLSKLVLSFRDWGRDCVCPSGVDGMCGNRFSGQYGELPEGYDHKYTYSHFGYNLKVTEMQAAIGVEQLKKLSDFADKRRENWNYLLSKLKPFEDRVILPQAEENSNPSWFGFIITLREGSGLVRNDITRKLEEKNIQTRLLFAGNLIRHPAFDGIRNTDLYRVADVLKNTDYIMDNSFWIGVYPGMTKDKLSYMTDALSKILSN